MHKNLHSPNPEVDPGRTHALLVGARHPGYGDVRYRIVITISTVPQIAFLWCRLGRLGRRPRGRAPAQWRRPPAHGAPGRAPEPPAGLPAVPQDEPLVQGVCPPSYDFRETIQCQLARTDAPGFPLIVKCEVICPFSEHRSHKQVIVFIKLDFEKRRTGKGL